jgi:hypothetical protein
MPPDLVDRINASIAAEQAARAHPDDRVVPLHGRRTPGWRKYGLVAAAVAGLAIGVPALLGTGPQDVMASLTRSSNDSAGAASSAQEASTASPPAASPTPSTPATPSTAGTGARATSAVGRVTMVATGTGYTARRLATQARDVLLSGSTHSTTAGGADHARDADGLRDCLTAMGVPAWTPVVADLATYDGRRAVVAVVSSDTGQTVYAVPTWCDATHARALAGPLPIH